MNDKSLQIHRVIQKIETKHAVTEDVHLRWLKKDERRE